MSIQQSILIEIQRETENTLRMLKALPIDKFDFKPHEKSMSLGELANHIVELHGWVKFVFTKNEFDFHTDYVPSQLKTVDELISALQSMTEQSIDVVNNLSTEEYLNTWTLKAGEHVIVSAPKAGAYRFIVTNHLVHHRGQLSVYLRLLDIPVPGIYGPSADEK